MRYQTRTKAELVVAEIESRLDDESLAPGSFIATKTELRIASGLAKSTINEAVRLLVERGRVEARQGRGGGLFVAAPSPVVRLRHTLLTIDGQMSLVEDAIELREFLEPFLDERAARARTPEDVVALHSVLTKMRNSTDSVADFLTVNWELHETIAACVSNEYLRSVYVATARSIQDMSSGASIDEPAIEDSYLQHRLDVHVELVEAIVAGDVGRTRQASAEHAKLVSGLNSRAGASVVKGIA